jgi:adenosine deaminase
MIDTRLPLTDIHRHLDGNIRAQTIKTKRGKKLFAQGNIPLRKQITGAC